MKQLQQLRMRGPLVQMLLQFYRASLFRARVHQRREHQFYVMLSQKLNRLKRQWRLEL
jgi:hypothetical protein